MFLFHIAKKHWAGILLITLLGGAAALATSLTVTPLYSSSSRLLILQKNTDELDAYSAARANEKLGESLTHLIHTASFLNKTIEADLMIGNDFPRDEAARRKLWNNIVRADLQPNTSLLTVTVQHPDPVHGERIVIAVNSVLAKETPEYVGLPSDQVVVRIVDAPLTSTRPVVPQVSTLVLSGLCMGLLLSFGFAAVRETIMKAKWSRTGALPTAASSAASGETPAIPHERVLTQTPEQRNVPASTPPAFTPQELERIHTMHDDALAPFGSQYYFQNRLIDIGNEN